MVCNLFLASLSSRYQQSSSTYYALFVPSSACSALWTVAQPDAGRAQADAAAAGRWHPVWGDRCQELVWIGMGMDEAAIRAMLDACLLTDEEMALGPEAWAEQIDDPLPPWVGDEEYEEFEAEEDEEL